MGNISGHLRLQLKLGCNVKIKFIEVRMFSNRDFLFCKCLAHVRHV